MSDLIAQLEQLQAEAAAVLAAAQSTPETEAWYADYLGRKGRMTAMLRGLGQLSPEERPLVGKRANEIKVVLESALQERQDAIQREEMERALAAEAWPRRCAPAAAIRPGSANTESHRRAGLRTVDALDGAARCGEGERTRVYLGQEAGDRNKTLEGQHHAAACGE